VFLLEFTCTFVLVYVVFATAVDKTGAAKVTHTHTHTHTHREREREREREGYGSFDAVDKTGAAQANPPTPPPRAPDCSLAERKLNEFTSKGEKSVSRMGNAELLQPSVAWRRVW
jgi:hypothetical protein